MSEAPAREWGIVYSDQNTRDVLLDQRYTTETATVGVMRQIARQYIASRKEDDPYLSVNLTAQNVMRVASQKTGRTFIRMRPIVAERWLASGQAPAPPEIDAYVRALLDDDDWM